MAQSQSVSPDLIERSTVGLSYRGSYFTLATLLRERSNQNCRSPLVEPVAYLQC